MHKKLIVATLFLSFRLYADTNQEIGKNISDTTQRVIEKEQQKVTCLETTVLIAECAMALGAFGLILMLNHIKAHKKKIHGTPS